MLTRIMRDESKTDRIATKQKVPLTILGLTVPQRRGVSQNS